MKIFSIMKTLSINLIILTLIVGFFEMVFGQWFFKWHFHNNIIDYVSCKNSLTYWSYCPNTNAINRMSAEDGSAWIDNYVNKSSVRVKSRELMNSKTKFNDYQIYITGDSFIQADETNFNETLGFWIEKKTGLKTLNHGYSSWAPVQYYNYLSTIKFDPDDIVILFTSINDFIQEDNNSNLNWYNREHVVNNDGDIRFVITEADFNHNRVISSQKSKSVLYQIYYYLKKRYETNTEKIIGFKKFKMQDEWKDYEVFDDKIVKLQSDCNILKKYKNISKITFEYLHFAFDEKCYTDKFKRYLDSGVNDIIKLSNYLKKTKTTLIVIPYPTMFSFINEGVVIKQHPYFSASPGSIITSQGLSKYLKKRIDNKVIEIEESLLKKYDSEKNNELYFNEDGHWNSYSHKIIGNWLGNYINSWIK